ncbi:MAG: cytochrome-c oxidase, cbb3-type subunit III [Deltaproteobacteria bacterium]|nr:cytochrome-c oxidase, cbb3-type subunit III [Deltaproteobacteria bacterium]
MAEKHDPYAAKDTGHAWDEIKELDNPPPRWWMIGMHISWISVVIYFILFPSIPLVDGSTKGILGWTQIKRLKNQVAEVEALRKPYNDKLSGMSVNEILKDNELLGFAQGSAKVLFAENCAGCHGVGGQGGPDFPVLADDDWLYGGTADTIVETITDGRAGIMNAHASLLSKQEVDDVVKYVMGLSRGEVHEPGKAVFMGETEGEAACFGCHGEDAKGMPEMGAPNLTDSIWRFSSAEEDIRQTVLHGVNDEEEPQTRKAIMPAFAKKLDETQIKKLAVMVHQFGGGK